MTTSPKDCSAGSTPSRAQSTSSGSATAGSVDRSPSTKPTSSPGKKPHGLTGRKGGHGGKYTPAELEETRKQMLATPYEQVKAEFMQSVAESKEKPKRRPAARRNPVTVAMVEREFRKALGELEQ